MARSAVAPSFSIVMVISMIHQKEDRAPASQKTTRLDSLARQASQGGRYYEAVGRRKTSVARVRIWEGTKRATSKTGGLNDFAVVNARALSVYFPIPHLQQIVVQPLEKLGLSGIKMEVRVSGGGIHSQAEAVRHGVARALVKKDPAVKPLLNVLGFLTRDARAKERRKFGLKKARRAPQWAKR